VTNFVSTLPGSRRHWLKNSSCGFGALALAAMLPQSGVRAAFGDEAIGIVPTGPHFEPKAKRVIFVFLQGAPSHLDLVDYKPRLNEDNGKPESSASDSGNPRKFLGSPWKFAQHGQSGQWFSELLPNVATHADRWCIVKSLTTDIPNHPQAVLQLHTGSHRFTRPSLGSWVLYGLGTENQELPGFVSINALTRVGGVQNYGNAFLPAQFQATRIGNEGEDISKAQLRHIHNAKLSSGSQREQLALLSTLHANRDHAKVGGGDAELDSIIDSYELAFRMQDSAPKLLDISSESAATHELYGVGKQPTDNFGRQCLMARRLSESGVRFVEITHTGWDHHNNLRQQMTERTAEIDQPIAALITDLAQRDLLKDTLVVVGGEFGRTATAQNDDGRDHSVSGFPMLLAGGGVKPGFSYGATDEYGIKAVEGKSHIYDLQATILHTLGLDHQKLTYTYAGRPFRLTDVYGNVLNDILS
jgi:hypothetical protein